MKQRTTPIKNWILPLLYILLGSSLLTCGLFEWIDSFWSGMGGGLLAVGLMRIIQLIRYTTSQRYKEQSDTAAQDERNHFLRAKAWSWAGYLFIMIAAVGTIVCKLLEQEIWMTACSSAVCLLIVLYWMSYLILSKKY